MLETKLYFLRESSSVYRRDVYGLCVAQGVPHILIKGFFLSLQPFLRSLVCAAKVAIFQTIFLFCQLLPVRVC